MPCTGSHFTHGVIMCKGLYAGKHFPFLFFSLFILLKIHFFIMVNTYNIKLAILTILIPTSQ